MDEGFSLGCGRGEARETSQGRQGWSLAGFLRGRKQEALLDHPERAESMD